MAKILIIGGGVSGLSAGIYAQLNGHQAVVCERHSIAGGNLTGWQRGEYHIDNCIHWLTGTNPATNTYKMWTELGALGNVEVYQGESLYTCERNGQKLSLNKDIDLLLCDMLSISPEDEKESRALVNAVKALQGILGIAGTEHNEKSGTLQKIKSIPSLLKYYRLTTGELAARFSHPLLRNFITSLMGDRFGSLALIMVFAHFCGENGGIPKGSSCAMVERMTERLNQLGGELLLRKEAVKINHQGGSASSVTFADGSTIEADYIVITTDPAVAFEKLLDMDMPKQLKKRYRNPQMARFSSYQCAFSCDLPKLPFSGDFVFEIPSEYRAELQTNDLIIREFSHEEEFAPKGKNILQTLTFCTEQSARRFIELRKNKGVYQKTKQKLADMIQTLITEKFPEMKGKLKCIDVWTPATYRRYTDSEIGSYMSFTLPSKAMPTRLDNKIAKLKNVIMATQWLQAPGGLPIAAIGGKKAVETILKIEACQPS